jgi:hypothetical protein
MKALPWLAGFLLLLSSCSVLQNAGIEKRKYNKGFYFDRPSSTTKETKEKAVKDQSASNTTVHYAATDSVLIENHSTGKISETENIFGAHRKTSYVKLRKKIAGSVPLLKHPRKIFNLTRSKLPAPKIHSDSGVKTRSNKTLADLIIDILFDVFVLLLALLIIAMFPGMAIGLAELIAVVFILLVLLGICLIWRVNN